MKRWLKRIGYGIAGLLAFVALAVALVAIVLDTDWGRSKVRDQIESELNKRVRGDVSIGKIEGSVLGDMVLHDVAIDDIDDKRVVTIDRLRLSYSLLSLADRRIEADAIEAHGVSVLDRGTLDELWIQAEEEQKPFDWTVIVDRLQISDASFRRRVPDAQPIDVEQGQLHASLRYDAVGLEATVHRAGARWKQRQLRADLSGQLRQRGSQWNLDDFNLVAGQSRLTVGKLAADLESGQLGGDFSVRLAPRDIRRLAPSIDMKHQVFLTGDVTRPAADQPWQINVHGQSGRAELEADLGIAPGHYRGTIELDDVSSSQLVAGGPPGRANAQLSFNLRGEGLEQLTGNAHLTGSGAVLQHRFSGVKADASFDRGRIELDARARRLSSPSYAVQGLTIHGQTGNLAGARIEASARRISAGPRSLANVEIEMRGNRLLEGRGPARAEFRTGAIDAGMASAAKLTGTIEIDQLQRMQLDRAHVMAMGVRIGDERIGPVELDARGRSAQAIYGRLKVGSSKAPYHGQVAVQAELGERRTHLELTELELTTRKHTWTGTGEVVLGQAGRIAVNNVSLRSDIGEVNASARLSRRSRQVDLEVSSLDLEQLRLIMPETMDPPPLFGTVTASIQAGDRPLTGAIRGKVEGFRMNAASEPIDIQMKGDVAKGALALQVAAQAEHIGRARLELDASLPRRPMQPAGWQRISNDNVRRLHLEFRKLDLARLARLAPQPPDLEGKLNGKIEFRDGGDAIDIDLRLLGGRHLPLREPVDFELVGSGGVKGVDASVLMEIDDTTLASGRVHLDAGIGQLLRQPDRAASTEFSTALSLPRVPLTVLTRTLGLREPVQGYLTGTVSARGTIGEPRGKASLELEGARWRGVRFAEARLGGELDPEGWSGEARIRQKGGGWLSARAEKRDQSALTASMRARAIQLSPISPILRRMELPVLDIAGRLDGRMQLRGDAPPDEMLSGKLTVRDGRVRLLQGIRRISDLRLNATVQNGRVSVVGRGDSGPGTLRLRAKAGLDGLMPSSVDALLRVRKVPIKVAGTDAIISADADLDGQRKNGLWRLDAEVEDGLVRLPDPGDRRKLHPTGRPEDVIYASELPLEQPTLSADAEPTLRLTVSTPGGVKIRSADQVEAIASAELEVTKVGTETVIEGTAEIERGSIRLFDRKWEVQRAVVSFDGQVPARPHISLTLSHAFDTATVFVDIRGTADEPKIELRSDPPIYSRAELLGFVLGGEPGGGPDERGLQEGALSAASSILAGKIESLVANRAPFDTVRLGTDEDTEDVISHVTVGRWVGEDLFVAYQRRFEADDDENSNEAIVEYHFARRWLLRGEFGDRGSGGLDVLWVKRYD